MDDGNLIMGLKTIVNQSIFGYGIRKKKKLRLLLLMLFGMDVKFGDVVSLENHGEI
jgi:hypothetical protein